MPKAEAILEDKDGRLALRFERRLKHSPEDVWKALVEPGELRSWHPTPFELEPKPGGSISYREGPEMSDGEVIAYEPPHTLAYTWGEDELRWELRPAEAGCLLILTHSFADRFKAARDAAGWDICLEALLASLEGRAPEDREDGESLPVGWAELNAEYERRFGIRPEAATPPPTEAQEAYAARTRVGGSASGAD
jgi:uncharacterized protein YndB with AHSA1/START domain